MAASQSDALLPDINRARLVAQGVLCLLAGGCAMAAFVGMSGKTGERATSARTQPDALGHPMVAPSRAPALIPSPQPAAASPAFPAALPPPAPSLPFPPTLPPVSAAAPPATIANLVPPPSMAGAQPSLRPVSPAPSMAPPPAPRPSLPADKKLKTPQAMEGVMAARAMREQGEMQGAIEALKSADLMEPDHPEILGEMAITYEEMGLQTRAEPLWRQIYTMGEAGAGGYYTLASSKISTRPSASPLGAATGQGLTVASPVNLGPCRLSREPLAGQGERIALRVPILASPGVTIDPTKIEIHVTFFESVNQGQRVEEVAQERTAQSWSTMPLDWRDVSGEAVDVTYDLLSRRAGVEGERSFHGHMVKLFYQDKLVGSQAQPESLRGGAPQRPVPAGLDNALFPK